MMIRLILLFFCFNSTFAKASAIDKAFNALNRKDYYTANLLFTKASKKDPSISYFGLAQLYLKHDFLNLDSAYQCILRSENTFSFLSPKHRVKYATYYFDSLSIQSWKQTVSDAFFEIEKIQLSENGLQNFIDRNKWSRKIDDAIYLRDSIAFNEVKNLDSSGKTIFFLSKYPNSIYARQAQVMLQDQQYRENTHHGNLANYERFISDFKENYHLSDAENRIYELYTGSGELNSFKGFISKYPQNRNVNDAWKQLYRLYMSDFESIKFESFEREFPDFPFKEDLKQDKVVFLENYFPVAIDQKYGYMNSIGTIVIEPNYDEVGPFRNGLAVVAKESKFGLVNKKNELIVDFIYDEIVDFQEDRAIISKNESYNLIDRSGKEISSIPFKDLSNFSKGIYIGLKDSVYQFFDKNINEASELKCQEFGNLIDGYSILQVDDLYGVVDSNLIVKIPFQFDEIQRFDKNTFIYSIKDKKGLIRSDGTKITEPIYDEISLFNLDNNTAVVRMGHFIYWIRKDGSKFFDFSTEYFSDAIELAQFSKGFAIIRKKGKYGFIDEKGKLAFKPSLDITSKFVSGLTVFKNGKWGLVDFKNKQLKPHEFDLIEDWNGKGILVQKNGLSGLWDYKFETILPIEFNSIKVFENQFYLVTKGSKCGLYDFKGKQIIPVIYDRIQVFEKDCLTLINETDISYFFIRTNHHLKQAK